MNTSKPNYFTKAELALWLCSETAIIASNLAMGHGLGLSLLASVIGVTALIFNAKGNPTGPALMVVFSLMYGYISFGFAYYGEMLTYVGMSLPMAVVSFFTWMKNPFKGNHAEVTVNLHISPAERVFMAVLTAAVTVVFYYILKYFNTANLIPSTVSVATSFAAVYLSFRRNPYFAFAYAINDIVLIVLWVLASLHDASYLSVVVCFAAFFVNDMYSFINWKRISRRQLESA